MDMVREGMNIGNICRGAVPEVVTRAMRDVFIKIKDGQHQPGAEPRGHAEVHFRAKRYQRSGRDMVRDTMKIGVSAANCCSSEAGDFLERCLQMVGLSATRRGALMGDLRAP